MVVHGRQERRGGGPIRTLYHDFGGDWPVSHFSAIESKLKSDGYGPARGKGWNSDSEQGAQGSGARAKANPRDLRE